MILRESLDHFEVLYYSGQMERNYTQWFLQHFSDHRQMIFVMGPRQSGKTTVAQHLVQTHTPATYMSWDNLSDRERILQGPAEIARHIGLAGLQHSKPLLCLDEIHKYAQWRDVLKGFYDSYPDQTRILVTGSAMLDVFRRGGDSLMGRYFPITFHPLSVAELAHSTFSTDQKEIRDPKNVDDHAFEALWRFGGYPDPYLKHSDTFHRRWQRLRAEQLMQEDIRDLTRLQDIGRLTLLAEYLKRHATQQLTYSNIAKRLRISDHTVREWLSVLKALYYCFEIKPFSKNITRSLLKEPKYYLWDWSVCVDDGARAENFVALALLKAVHCWNDLGLGEYALHYLRDKEKREVDFIVVKNNKPWILVEAKLNANQSISSHLYHFQAQLKADYALQVVLEQEYIDKSCFIGPDPLIVPARTFLSQLV